MTTARYTVETALRKIGVLGGGRAARTSDATDALEALKGMYGSWIASGAFGRLDDVIPTGTNYTARGNERIYRQSAGELSVDLPETVSDGWVRDYGHERDTGYYGTSVTITTEGVDTIIRVEPSQPMGCVVTPRDGSPVIISDAIGGQTRTWLYDGTIKRWQSIDDLTLDDDAPRSVADPLGLASCLAMEIADTYGDAGVITAVTQQQAARFKIAMTQRFGMRRETVCGVYA